MTSRTFSFVTAALVSALVAGLGSRECQAQGTEAADAQVMKVMCPAQVKQAAQSKRSLTRKDEGLRLKAHDEIQCTGPDYLEILLPTGIKKITAADGPFPIPALGPEPRYNRPILEALTQYGIPGASRGVTVGSRLLWPSEGSAVLPEHFAVRWIPVSQKIVLSILSEARDVTILAHIEVDGRTGSWKSDTATSALASYKAKSGGTGVILTLALADSSASEEVAFSLLNGGQERELNAQLDFWAKNSDGLALHLGRAYSFLRHKLFAEAADEYDSALNSSPESSYVLEDAIEANRRAGRTARVKELQARLSSL